MRCGSSDRQCSRANINADSGVPLLPPPRCNAAASAAAHHACPPIPPLQVNGLEMTSCHDCQEPHYKYPCKAEGGECKKSYCVK